MAFGPVVANPVMQVAFLLDSGKISVVLISCVRDSLSVPAERVFSFMFSKRAVRF